MAFIDTISPSDARGDVKDMYARQQATYGYVPNYAKVFCQRPEVLARWGRLLAEIRRPMSDRLFELATFVAAVELKNTACSLAHGQKLADFIGDEAVVSVAEGIHPEVLTEAESAVVQFARKIARDASGVNPEDIEALRESGYTDAEIFDIAATAAGRAFLTKLLDALGVKADVTANATSGTLREPLTMGRPVCENPVEVLGV